MWYSKKHYPHSIGLSACFRQWRASSHCNQLHGYALAFTFHFESDNLDERNWVMDFGNLKPVKSFLESTFDHRLVVAEDDPLLAIFRSLEAVGGCKLTIMPQVGCEAFAKAAFDFCESYIEKISDQIRLKEVWCEEHEGNGAAYSRPRTIAPAKPDPIPDGSEAEDAETVRLRREREKGQASMLARRDVKLTDAWKA